MEGPNRHQLAHALELGCRAVSLTDLDERPDPLPGFSAAQVADHLVNVLESFADELGAPPSSGEAPHDRSARFGVASSRVIDGWSQPDRQKSHDHMTKEDRRWVLMCELAVHGWDLGFREHSVPPGTASACLHSTSGWISHYRDAGTVGAQKATDSLLVIDQLAAMFGRDVG